MPPAPHSTPTCWWRMRASGVLFCWELLLGIKSVGFIYFSLPVRLPSEIQKLPPDPPVRGFPGVWKLPLLRLPSRDRSPSLTLFSLFIFYILSYLLSKTVGCFSGHLMSSASNQELFCDICSAFNCSFDEFVGEKEVSLSYSSTILAPPFYCYHLFKFHIYALIYCIGLYLSGLLHSV